MIEILNCLYLTIFFSVLYRLKFNDVIIKKLFKSKDFSLFEKYSLNILIILLLLLFFSFFSFDSSIIAYFLIVLSIISIVQNIKKNNFINYFLNKDIIILLTFSFVISINLIANFQLGWDGHVWYFKALNFYENFSFFNLKNTTFDHYPHLGGIIWGLFWKISFLDYEYFGRIAYIFIYVVSILLIVEKMSENLATKLIFALIFFLLTYDFDLFRGYQGYLLFSIIVIIVNLLDKINLKKVNYYQLTFFIFSAYLLTWIKNEGLVYFSFFVFYIIFFQKNKKKIYCLFLFLILILLRTYLIDEISNSDITNFISFNLSLGDLLFKIYLITKYFIIGMFKYPIWILLFVSLFLNKLKKKDFYIIYFSMLSILFIYSVFIFSGAVDLVWYLSGSLDRLMFPLSGFFMLFISYRFKHFLKFFIK